MKFINRNKKYIILFSIGLLFILVGILSWNLYFSKYKQFSDQEKIFLESAQRYYSFNQNFLPKVGETREVTYKFLSENEHVVALYIPNTDKLCDLENSWVRVYKNDKNEYEYTTYLKCGKFESTVDHEGPVITLKGNEQIVVSLNSNYEEPGVEKITDNIDGNIDVNKVTIDSSNVNTSKVGTYKITYTIRDKAYNKTVITRKVIVAKNLTEVVKNDTDDSNYYRGSNTNNYLIFSGMLFRIVNVNDDGSVVLISDSAITYLRFNHDVYQNSNVDSWLNNIFYNNIYNKEYLVDKNYCVGTVSSINDISNSCSNELISKVGLLSINEYNSTILNGETFLNTGGGYFALGHKLGEDNYLAIPMDLKNGIESDILAPIRPVINLKSNLFISNGDGTASNPYKLYDYKYGKENDLLNTRIIGEYVEYSGLKFRILGLDKNNNVKVIMSDPLMIQPNNTRITLKVSGNTKFNNKEKDNYGYILNNDYLDYIDTKYLVNMEYEIPINDSSLKYNEYKTEKVNGKILLSKTYELFSAIDNNYNNRTSNYMYIDQSTSNDNIFVSTGGNTLAYEMFKDNFGSYDIKGVMTLKGNIKIASGKGTVNNPYRLK